MSMAYVYVYERVIAALLAYHEMAVAVFIRSPPASFAAYSW